MTLAGRTGGEGKSFFLKGLAAVVGPEHVFWSPTHPNFPLHGLEDTKIALLDEFRFMTSVVPIATQHLWFDGSPLPIAKPQTGLGSASHITHHGCAPVFITTSQAELDEPAEAEDGDATMVLRRLQVFSFTERLFSPGGTIPKCGRCFATFVASHARTL